jgi:hypothetical protein
MKLKRKTNSKIILNKKNRKNNDWIWYTKELNDCKIKNKTKIEKWIKIK